MANVRRTAMGAKIDMDMLRLSNETTIAVGNAKTNARGDELGSGGKVVKTRAQVMQNYHKLHSPIADDTPFVESSKLVRSEPEVPSKPMAQPVAEDIPVVESSSDNYVKPRGSFADAVAKETEVTQELLDPKTILGTAGIKRI